MKNKGLRRHSDKTCAENATKNSKILEKSPYLLGVRSPAISITQAWQLCTHIFISFDSQYF